MLLTIDVGNTNMVFGLYEGDALRGTFRISTNAERTSDELGMQISQYYHFHGIDRAETSAVIIASVVPQVMYTLINAIRKYLRVQPLVAGRDVAIGIENRYNNPREVGADRLVNAVSAVEQYGKPLIVVDIGTATTFDAIDEHGAYQGGVIFPGIKVAMEALFHKASKLPRVDIERPEKAIGKTTVQSMQSGAVRGYVGALAGIITDIRQELGGQVRVVATGGMGRMMAQYCALIDEVAPNLTLDGLRLIYERNREAFENRQLDGEICLIDVPGDN
ncbi:MAG: type III pantothenate kinase [Agathobaculum sp.]|uniref:type III pantothenate kinase n=1 Tax=Agathobaculum sp. TaxID=2048138 RepID=UPI0025BD233A|nr:type III pantothenate kinase [Agathobaculum sp.]MCI7126152.1 type III pantothenate kinase [Agathobaculum sp.]MDY3711351.1 type III pantothenate kinase [Agathobaculum sp.]